MKSTITAEYARCENAYTAARLARAAAADAGVGFSEAHAAMVLAERRFKRVAAILTRSTAVALRNQRLRWARHLVSIGAIDRHPEYAALLGLTAEVAQ